MTSSSRTYAMPRTITMPTLSVIILLLTIGSTSRVRASGTTQEHQEPSSQQLPVFNVDDPIATDPDELEFGRPAEWNTQQLYDVYENLFLDRGDPALPRAVNINTLGEVPESSWFTNRLGAVPMSADEIVVGPNLTGGPASGAFTVIGRPTGGVTPKFLVRDSAGQRFIFKFDPIGNEEMASAADAICSKFFYAAGYNVAEGYILPVRREQILVGEGTLFENELGDKTPITDEDVDRWMENAPRSPDGTYRVQASKFIEGEQVGEFRFYGTRSDDPNDIFLHEHRRELRGYRVISSWLNHDDSRATNTYDAFVSTGDKGHIRHYLLDFGSCLGSASVTANRPGGGYEYFLEKGPILKSMATLGIWTRPWLNADFPDFPAVGNIESEYYQPEAWKPEYPNQAFVRMDAADGFWAARIMALFSDDVIRRVVEAGEISDPEAERYLAETIIARRDKALAYWLVQTNPIDAFDVRGNDSSATLAWDNAAIRSGVAAPGTSYEATWSRLDNATGRETPTGSVSGLTSGSASVPAGAWGSADGAGDRYARVRLATHHPDFGAWLSPVVVTLRDHGGDLSVVGVQRPRGLADGVDG